MAEARIELKWVQRRVSRKNMEATKEPRVDWSLVGANNEFICGSGGQGFRDKADAVRAAERALELMAELLGHKIDMDVFARTNAAIVGPGPKPDEFTVYEGCRRPTLAKECRKLRKEFPGVAHDTIVANAKLRVTEKMRAVEAGKVKKTTNK